MFTRQLTLPIMKSKPPYITMQATRLLQINNPTTAEILTYNCRLVVYYEVDFTHPLTIHWFAPRKRNSNLQQAANLAKSKFKL